MIVIEIHNVVDSSMKGALVYIMIAGTQVLMKAQNLFPANSKMEMDK